MVVVIGAGAAGMMAAASAVAAGAEVVLLEKNDALGKKLRITGGGRCNITNACDIEGVLDKTLVNPRFLYSALYTFSPDDVNQFFNQIGVATKIEDGGRVFPCSDSSGEVVGALGAHLEKLGVKILLNTGVKGITCRPANTTVIAGLTRNPIRVAGELWGEEAFGESGGIAGQARNDGVLGDGDLFFIEFESGEILTASSCIIATGGLSYPATGSTGDGLRFAESFGHGVVKTRPALTPLVCSDGWVPDLMGLSLSNVSIDGHAGELVFTHFGISGPLALTISCHITKYPATIALDLLPDMDKPALDAKLLEIFTKNQNRDLKNALEALLPKRLTPIIITLAGIDNNKKVNSTTKSERADLVTQIKSLKLTITGNKGYGEAVITAGGVGIDQIDPSTMESKLIPRLYFAGEVLDLHALTGGYNLQIAFSTGHLAGLSAALA
ncbi:MAG: NAD(P)/FAD-dependent oxidoreductase [Defluviitaleaceae bacterium]|nr:NAD(P)/FAD-dependent oxidoreductase [Defluviitaleaceae bacterium]